MKKIIFLLCFFALSLQAQTVNALDPDFGAEGIATLHGHQGEFGNVMVLQDQKIIATTNVGSSSTLFRFDADGTYDTAFASTLPSLIGKIKDWVLLPDGRIVMVVGQKLNHKLRLLRLNADLTVDTTFGANGVVEINPNSIVPIAVSAEFSTLRLAPSGKLICSGIYNDGIGNDKPFVATGYTLGVDTPSRQSLRFWPNPANDVLHISTQTDAITGSAYAISDISGRM